MEAYTNSIFLTFTLNFLKNLADAQSIEKETFSLKLNQVDVVSSLTCVIFHIFTINLCYETNLCDISHVMYLYI